jgi:hypothetical protein
MGMETVSCDRKNLKHLPRPNLLSAIRRNKKEVELSGVQREKKAGLNKEKERPYSRMPSIIPDQVEFPYLLPSPPISIPQLTLSRPLLYHRFRTRS